MVFPLPLQAYIKTSQKTSQCRKTQKRGSGLLQKIKLTKEVTNITFGDSKNSGKSQNSRKNNKKPSEFSGSDKRFEHYCN